MPRNPATNAVRGRSYSSAGEPSCSITPWFMTATVSAMVMASSWSCVTWMNVMPTSDWIRFSSSCIWLAQLQVERAERLVEQQHPGPVDERPGQRDALLLAARHLPRLAAGQAAERHQLDARRRPAVRISAFETLALAQAEGDVVERSTGAGTARSSGRRCSRRAGTAAAS